MGLLSAKRSWAGPTPGLEGVGRVGTSTWSLQCQHTCGPAQRARCCGEGLAVPVPAHCRPGHACGCARPVPSRCWALHWASGGSGPGGGARQTNVAATRLPKAPRGHTALPRALGRRGPYRRPSHGWGGDRPQQCVISQDSVSGNVPGGPSWGPVFLEPLSQRAVGGAGRPPQQSGVAAAHPPGVCVSVTAGGTSAGGGAGSVYIGVQAQPLPTDVYLCEWQSLGGGASPGPAPRPAPLPQHRAQLCPRSRLPPPAPGTAAPLISPSACAPPRPGRDQ